MRDKNTKILVGAIVALVLIIAGVFIFFTDDASSTRDNNENFDPSNLNDILLDDDDYDQIGNSFEDTRNAQRSSDVLQILNAVVQYGVQLEQDVSDLGNIPACDDSAAVIGTSEIDLSQTLVDEYIVGIPLDPIYGTAEDTGYTICMDESGRVNISAPYAEGGDSISVSR